ncbi:MAG: transcription antitermination factor NusB [Bacteroidetes bacterium QS_7_67_15]|jgi:N utilization substance protein B|nr:MAG: transcription antitermination factor NusB [Bacteroidetes bacterium QH_8_67_23]PSQ84044.1 MAG: transcription antitermination factor NusB [Bacteroidetes bacterium QS_7_67_15]PSQ92370.1 MAG: transcription antitermination factor NusB [Bacteroidetes bacterium SW_4_67_19]
MSTRREARVCAVQALYAHDLAGGRPHHHVKTVIEPELDGDEDTQEFASRLFMETLLHQEEADEAIARRSENWDLDRFARLDHVLLRMAVAELLAFEDIPPKVTLDEAVELAKAFGTDRSGSFVNGVLDAVVIDLEREGRLHKTGRGLVGIESIRERAAASSNGPA